MLTDYGSFKSVETALHIIDAYRKFNPDTLSWQPPPVIKGLEEPGMSIEDVLEACQEEIGDFMEIRKNYLLYR